MRGWMFLIFFSRSYLAGAETLLLPLGQVRPIQAAQGKSVHVGSKAILQVADFGDHLTVIGKKVGETHLIIGQKTYSVQVIPRETEAFRHKLDELLGHKMGLTRSIRNGRIVVEGSLYRFEDWRDIADLATDHAVTYDFAARPLPDVAEAAVRFFVERARALALPTPRLVLDGGLRLSLPAGSDGYVAIAQKTFSPFGLTVQVTPSQVTMAPLVRTVVILAELSRQVTRTFGIQWPQNYQAKILPQWEPPADLMLELKALENKGLGKVLASPNLLCRSGSVAEFLAGGELPIRTSKFFGGEFLWKKHGVLLKVKPLADSLGAISLDIETEVSVIDSANAIDGIPAMKTNRVHSHFDLTGRKTVVLSGLLREDLSRDHEGVAGLASLLILGNLFKSQSFIERKSELVIFVTPEVVLPEADGDPIRLPEGWARDEI